MRPGRSLAALAAFLSLVATAADDAAQLNLTSTRDDLAAAAAAQNRPAELELQLTKTRDYTAAVGERIEAIYEGAFPEAKREAGMTQAEFTAAAKQLMAALAADDLYTASASSRPGAVRPAFDWPWTRNFQVTEGVYFHLGWRRGNKTLLTTDPADGMKKARGWIHRRPHIQGEWSDVPADCAKGQQNFLWTYSYFHPFGYDPDGPDLYLCKGSPPAGTALPALPKTNHRVTLCVHKVLNIGGLHMRMRPEWLRAYFEYYTALGVDHFYVYVSRIPFIDVPGFSYDWIDATWMHAFVDNMYGQIWAMDDCLYRNKEQGNGWTLFVDIDELVVLPGVARGLKGLADALEEQKYESANFHSVGYIASACEEEEDMWPGGSRKMGLADRIVYRAIFPENCEDIWQSNCTFMNKLAQGGRRKVFTKAVAPNSMEIHSLSWMENMTAYYLTRPGLKEGDFKPLITSLAMNGTRLWVKHVRGVGFEHTKAPAKERLLCSGRLEVCDPIPGGLQCHGGVGEAGMVNPTNTWIHERPYNVRAREMGGVLAGSYEMASWGGAI